MNSDERTENLDDHALLLQLITLVRESDARQGNRLQSLEDRLQSLEHKVDERLYDTRPMWEAVQVQLGELREEVGQMAKAEDMAMSFRKLDSKLEMLAREVRDLYADERELERRVGNLESKIS